MSDSNLIAGTVTASDAEGVLVETAHGTLRVPGDTPVGRDVTLTIRPEHLEIGDSKAVSLGEGKLVEQHFFGTHQRSRVLLGGQELLVRAPVWQRLAEGTTVRLSLDPADLVLLA